MDEMKLLLDRAGEEDRCLGYVDGYWNPGTILRVNEDGTFMVKFAGHPMLLPYTYGVPQAEISVDDEALWPGVLSKLTGGQSVMSCADYGRAMALSGFRVSEERVQGVWLSLCGPMFGIQDLGAQLTLDQAYQVVRASGSCAKQISLGDVPGSGHRAVYINQVRMGGRNPAEVAREVTLDDALEAMGIDGDETDEGAVVELDFIESRSGVRVPPMLRRFLTRGGAVEAVRAAHPNNPTLVLPSHPRFRMLADPPVEEWAEMAITFLVRDQGQYSWSAVYSEGDEDARVYLNWTEDEWSLASPTSSFFFWDLAQTGLSWWQRPTIPGHREMERTDIGMKRAR